MKRKSMAAIIISFAIAVTMMAGCESKQADIEAVTFEKTEIGNVIAKDPIRLSDLLYKVTLKKGQTVKDASLVYGGETVKLEAEKEPQTGTKVFTVTKDKAIKELVDKNQVPNAILSFMAPSKTASDLKVCLTLTDKDKKTSTESVSMKVRVLPETIKPVKAITQNLKLSEDLKDYDFDVRAKNIADKAAEIETITVKKSNVKFGRTGHYTVTYEVRLATANVDVTTDVEITDAKKDDGVITDEKDTTANTDNNTPTGNNTPSGGSSDSSASSGSDGGSASGNANSNSSNNSNNGNSPDSSNNNSSNDSKPAPHTHNWKAHTATKQVWVSNIVTVTDYENQAQHKCDTRCSDCGAVFGSPSACADHKFATGHGGSQNIACTHISKVVVGSHTEDHGHYEQKSYTDYEYCDCGARR